MDVLLQRCQQANKTIRAQRAAIGVTLPAVTKQAIVAANGDGATARELAASLAPAVELMETRPWEAGMITQPGDPVRNPDDTHTYLYSGAAAMSHANPTFYPGAQGVHYWAIIPAMQDGIKVFPDVPGIIVFVKQGEQWFDPQRSKVYEWTAGDFHCPTHQYPGAVGVHSWVPA